MATLFHDDLIDGAHVRRGKAAAWTAHGADAARAAGDYIFARAFSELAARGDVAAVAILAEASLALARGEAMQRRQRFDPDTTVEGYLARCSLKTGKLFEAACLLGGGSGDYGRLLGISFQIVDDILDCAGDTIETGKIPGTDLRDGTVTLPLILAAESDPSLHTVDLHTLNPTTAESLCDRITATGALDQVRTRALQMVTDAKQKLNAPQFDAEQKRLLELVADGVVERYA